MSDDATGTDDNNNDKKKTVPYSVTEEWNERIKEFNEHRKKFPASAILDWNERVEEFKVHGKRYGNNSIVVTKDKEKLQKWMTHLRKHEELLTPEQVSQLIKIGFLGKNPGVWELNFAKLCDYKKRFGNCKLS
jgi:Helicase associated domain